MIGWGWVFLIGAFFGFLAFPVALYLFLVVLCWGMGKDLKEEWEDFE